MAKSIKYLGSKKLLYALLLSVIVVVSFVILEASGKIDVLGGEPVTSDGKKVNLDPPTKADVSETEANKEAIVKRDARIKESSSTSSGQKKQASLVITDAVSTGIRGYVSNIFEEGGVCTATATQGSQTFTKSSVGFQNVSYTQCAPLQWDTMLNHGNWVITLSYSSATAEGTISKTIDVK